MRRDELRRFFSVGGGTRPAAVNVGGEVVDFFAVFVGYFITCGGAGVGSENDAVFENDSDDCGSSFEVFWGLEVGWEGGGISLVICE